MIEATVKKGEKESDVIELKGRLCGINNLLGWDTNKIFVLGSHDNNDFFYIMNAEGKTLTFDTYPHSKRKHDFFATIDSSYNGLEGIKYIKFITMFDRIEQEERKIKLIIS